MPIRKSRTHRRRRQLVELAHLVERDRQHVEAFPGARLTGADHLARLAAEPLTGGDAAPPAGGLFDEDARNQVDLFDL